MNKFYKIYCQTVNRVGELCFIFGVQLMCISMRIHVTYRFICMRKIEKTPRSEIKISKKIFSRILKTTADDHECLYIDNLILIT